MQGVFARSHLWTLDVCSAWHRLGNNRITHVDNFSAWPRLVVVAGRAGRPCPRISGSINHAFDSRRLGVASVLPSPLPGMWRTQVVLGLYRRIRTLKAFPLQLLHNPTRFSG